MAAAPESDGQDESMGQVFSRLYADGRAYAEAEMEKQKLRAALVGAGVRDAAIFGLAGGLIAFASLIAALVGIILTLAPVMGPGWATLTVFGSGVMLALILLLVAKGRITRMKRSVRS